MRILLADAYALNQRHAALMIERLGHSAPRLVADAQSIPFEPFDVLLLDADLPGLDSAWLARFAEQVPEARRVVILRSTAQAQRWLAAGAQACLERPLTAETLSRALAPSTDDADDADDFDSAAWAEMRRVYGADGCSQLLRLLADDLPEQRRRQARAMQEGDPATLAQIAHRLRGSSQQLGALALAELAAQAELAARDGQIDRAGALIEAVLRRLMAVIERLRAQLRDDAR